MSLSSFFQALSLSALYSWQDRAEDVVIIGVIIEEVPLSADIFKFFVEWRHVGFYSAFSKAKRNWEKIVASIGFALLVAGLWVGAVAQVEIKNKEGIARAGEEGTILALRRAAAPRDVADPRTWLIASMAIPTRHGVVVSSYMFDGEAARLGEEIIRKLNDVSYLVADNTLSSGAQRPLAFGIYVSGSNKILVNALIEWLNESHLDAMERAPPLSPMAIMGPKFIVGSPDATIFVGSKPVSNAPGG